MALASRNRRSAENDRPAPWHDRLRRLALGEPLRLVPFGAEGLDRCQVAPDLGHQLGLGLSGHLGPLWRPPLTRL